MQDERQHTIAQGRMIAQAASCGTIQRMDNRVRIATALLPAVTIATVTDLRALAAGMCLGILLLPAAGFSRKRLLRRFAAINLITLACVAILPFSMPGETVTFGLELSKTGLLFAGRIALKLNAISAICTTLLSTIEPAHFGAALRQLGVPCRLTELLFLTVRYTSLLREEYGRMRDGMKTRGYRPGLSMHNLRATGYLVGGLLTRSFARSERLLDAMHCRGYTGNFPNLRRPQPLALGDFCAIVGTVATVTAMIYLELQCRQIL